MPSTGRYVSATSTGTTLIPKPAATTRNAASKLDTITRYDTVRPALAAARWSIVCDGGRGRQTDVLVLERLVETQRRLARERMIAMYREREPVLPVGAVLQPLQIDVVPAHADRRRAFAQLPHESRQTLLHFDDVLHASCA